LTDKTCRWDEPLLRMKKTSVTHKLRIDPVVIGPGLGRIGITFCPGKYDPYGGSGYWDRNLARDLDVIRKWGAAAVVTLLEQREIRLLRVERLGEEVRSRGMRWLHLPIVDMKAPDEKFKEEWVTAGEELRSLLRRQDDVVVHCRGGKGRAGLVAACLLVEFGTEPGTAIAKVRAVRPGAIETDEQEDFVLTIRAP
jgi:ADP-ribosyl-[dinitrogen reductase] hydrolase